ncbi:hypothetical protein IAQ61_000704, partial [Plenodomus lingam]|uniref:uncharacterized protein n=1 Tax=Leptosphaeria maculans TaxID=5022 RepID=UPI003328EFC9
TLDPDGVGAWLRKSFTVYNSAPLWGILTCRTSPLGKVPRHCQSKALINFDNQVPGTACIEASRLGTNNLHPVLEAQHYTAKPGLNTRTLVPPPHQRIHNHVAHRCRSWHRAKRLNAPWGRGIYHYSGLELMA